jgi:HEAT repeat protein
MHRVPTLLLLCLAVGPVSADEVDLTPYLLPNRDDEWLKRSKVAIDPAGLLKFLKSCQGPETPPADVAALVAKLVAGDAAAAKKLADVGPLALPALRAHMTDPDLAVVKRVRSCIEVIERDGDKPLARPAIRRLVERRMPGAAEALLGYAPFAGDPAAEEDVWYGLDELADRDPKVLGVLDQALADTQPARRALAGCILGRRGSAAQKAAVRGLLKDADATVRLRAAQGLLAGRDKAGLPVLIELLTQEAVEVRWQAEELLRWTAVDTAPRELAGSADPKVREACRDAWRKWWAAECERLDLAVAEKEPRRPLLVLAFSRASGRVMILGCDGVERWAWTTREGLADAQYIPGGGTVTLNEQPVRKKPLLAERDHAGRVLWQHDNMADPKYCQRLSNGTVFVAEYQDIAKPFLTYQVVASGPLVVARQPKDANTEGHALRMNPDGTLVCAKLFPLGAPVRTCRLRIYDPIQGEDRAFSTEFGIDLAAGMVQSAFYVEEAGDAGLLLSGLAEGNNVDSVGMREYDPFGVVVWQYLDGEIRHAVRLRNQNTLASASGRIVEITPDKRVVGEVATASDVTVVRPCLSLVRLGFDTFATDVDLATDVEYRIRGLGKKDRQSRLVATQELQRLGPAAHRALPSLKALERDPDPEIRQRVPRAQAALGRELIPKMVLRTQAADPQTQDHGFEVLARYPGNPEILDLFLALLRDPNPRRRAMAAGLLASPAPNLQGRLSEEAVPRLHDWAADKIVPALLDRVTRETEESTLRVVYSALGAFRARSKAAVPILIRVARDPKASADTRETALRALGGIGDVTPEVVPCLRAVMAEPSPVRMDSIALEALAMIRSAKTEATRAALNRFFLTDGRDPVRAQGQARYCLYILKKVGADDGETIRFCTKVADDSIDLVTRRDVAQYLLGLGKAGATAAPWVRKWVEETAPGPDQGVGSATHRQLRQMFDQFRRDVSRAERRTP